LVKRIQVCSNKEPGPLKAFWHRTKAIWLN
jgi:hypothetical protein